MDNEKPIEPPTGNIKRKPGTQWICRKCDDTYTTPQPAKAVLCATCNKRLDINSVWMRNND
jgi:uncharacterized protein YlaI